MPIVPSLLLCVHVYGGAEKAAKAQGGKRRRRRGNTDKGLLSPFSFLPLEVKRGRKFSNNAHVRRPNNEALPKRGAIAEKEEEPECMRVPLFGFFFHGSFPGLSERGR